MPARIALLPSPLLGSGVWDAVATVLETEGLRPLVVSLPGGVRHPTDVRNAFLRSLRGERDLILVPHSNAGLYAPTLAESVGPLATVFVDAALPTSTDTARLATPAFLEFLTELADADGILPPWTKWWGDADVDSLFPNPRWRQRFEAAEPRLPLAYFEATVPVPAGWATRPCAYLAFGDTYAEELAAARSHGWPVEVLDGGHLHMLHDPVRVAGRLMDLVRRLERGDQQADDRRDRHCDGEAPHVG